MAEKQKDMCCPAWGDALLQLVEKSFVLAKTDRVLF